MNHERLAKLLTMAAHHETPDYEALNAVRRVGTILEKEDTTFYSLLIDQGGSPQTYQAFKAAVASRDEANARLRDAEADLKVARSELTSLRKRAAGVRALKARIAELEVTAASHGAQQSQSPPSRLMVTQLTVRAWRALQVSPGGLGVADLCQRLGYSQTGAKRLAKRFLDAGLVERLYQPRSVYVVAPGSAWTPAGRALVAGIEAA